MRKILQVLPIILASCAFAQTGFIPRINKLSPSPKGLPQTNVQKSLKSPGDTIFYEDFAQERWGATCNENYDPVPENAPEGYTLVDNSGNGYHWRWSDLGPRGAYIGGCEFPAFEALESETADNGFLLFEADWYNTTDDCELADPYIGHDAYIEYHSLDFSEIENVHVQFYQYDMLCCGYGSESDVFLSISTDQGESWTNIPIHYPDLGTGSPNPYFQVVDLSDIAASESDVWFRFYFLGLSHFYMGVDDVLFFETPDYDLHLTDVWEDYMKHPDPDFEYDETYNFYGGLYQIPWFTAHPFVGYRAAIENFGTEVRENVVYNVDVYRDEEFLVKHISNPISYTSGQIDTMYVNFANTTEAEDPGDYYMIFDTACLICKKGNYITKHYLTADHPDNIVDNDTIINEFTIGDSAISYVNPNQINGTISPDRWTSYSGDGDAVGFQITLPEPSYYDIDGANQYFLLSSVSVFIPEQTSEVMELIEANEAFMVAKVFDWNEVEEEYEVQIASAPYYLSGDDISQWVSISLLLDGFSEYLYDGGDYRVMIEFYGTYTTERLHTFEIGSDVSRDFPAYYSCVLGFDGNWGWSVSSGAPAVVLNLFSPTIYGGPPVHCGPQIGTIFRITNTENEPIPDVSVSVGEIDYSVNEDGLVFMPLHGNYMYHYQISASGYNVLNDSIILYNADTVHITLNPVGITEIEENYVKIFPNPCTSKFIIETEGEFAIRISNAAGEIVYEQKMNDNLEINTTNFASGVYFVKLSNDEAEFVRRIIVE